MGRNKIDQQRTVHPEIATKMLLSLKAGGRRKQWRRNINQRIENLNEPKPDVDASTVGRLFAV